MLPYRAETEPEPRPIDFLHLTFRFLSFPKSDAFPANPVSPRPS